MAAYGTRTRLPMAQAVARAREFFELQQGLTIRDRLGPLHRWQDPNGDQIELRAFPVKGGGTRLEIDTLRHDEMVRAFIHTLPRPSLLDELRERWDI